MPSLPRYMDAMFTHTSLFFCLRDVDNVRKAVNLFKADSYIAKVYGCHVPPLQPSLHDFVVLRGLSTCLSTQTAALLSCLTAGFTHISPVCMAFPPFSGGLTSPAH